MPSYTLTVRDRFEASHWLRSYQGEPEPIHGHSWTVEAILEATALDDEGMAFDFVAVRDSLRTLVARFDHGDINSVSPFDEETPTTEHLARFFHQELARRFGGGVVAVTVWEGPDCAATYRP